MFKPNQTLQHPVDFDNAMFLAVPVEVYQQGEPIDRGGPILNHTEYGVFINDGYFLKLVCQFIVN